MNDDQNPIPPTHDFDATLPHSAQQKTTKVSLGDADNTGDSPSIPSTVGRYRVDRVIGRGGFGLVYLAHDDQLERPVAIKVPHSRLVSQPEDLLAYLAEARTLAGLDHPNIVPVYDVGRTDDGLCFVVSKFIEGSTLAAYVNRQRPSRREVVGLLVQIAEALQFAHASGVVHRDIKPGNILVDNSGHPFLIDFGLARRDEDFGEGKRFMGTPCYMSPEQARGNGHLVDGRSDIFSLGVVLFELMTGQRPFDGTTVAETLAKVSRDEPPLPRSLNKTISKELERICLRSLAKRSADRYASALDLAQDLRSYDEQPVAEQPQMVVGVESTNSASLSLIARVVPKGLRSFDDEDTDFFLSLLPGPKNREGLPESVRFWKSKLESTDPNETFRIGLLYGPSGCGKSSLVKAGILPRLNREVVTVYLEATAENTEQRILNAVRRRCKSLPKTATLAEALAAIRRGKITASGQKLVIVIDQFEQWLHSHVEYEATELVEALRHCDGEKLQCVLMIRDDFWIATGRLLRTLEVEQVEGRNMAMVDLFDKKHATKVLTSFGRAYGCLPEEPARLTREQREFLSTALDGLAEDGRIISVRLALFAEMVKGRPWTRATLDRLGGTAGVGVAYLEETFESQTAPAAARTHAVAARAVLRALLPEQGTNIKGRLRSRQELEQASGLADDANSFSRLLDLLDAEHRLVTPTTAQSGLESVAEDVEQEQQQYYQLTHDFLVPALREWLTRKQRESAAGRAALRLSDLAESWKHRPERRNLPGILEHLSIRWFCNPSRWNETERLLMRQAARVHGTRAGMSILVAAILLTVGLWMANVSRRHYRDQLVKGQVDTLITANTDQLPTLMSDLDQHRELAAPLLSAKFDEFPVPSRQRLHAAIALIEDDETKLSYVREQMLALSASDFVVVREILKKHQDSLKGFFREIASQEKHDKARRFRASAALALYDPTGDLWSVVSSQVAEWLVEMQPSRFVAWRKALEPARHQFVEKLSSIVRDTARQERVRTHAAEALASYARSQPGLLVDLLADADPSHFAVLFEALTKHRAQAVAACKAELARQIKYDWRDPELSAFAAPSPEHVSAIQRAFGAVADRFAYCQAMPSAEFLRVVDGLRSAGFRPTRCRPFRTADGAVHVAAIWARDAVDFTIVHGVNRRKLRQDESRLGTQGMSAVDVAGYQDSKGEERFTAIFSSAKEEVATRLWLGEESEHGRLRNLGFVAQTWQQSLHKGGQVRNCGVWTKTAEVLPKWLTLDEFDPHPFVKIMPNHVDWDVTALSIPPGQQPDPMFSGTRLRVLVHANLQWDSRGLYDCAPTQHLSKSQPMIQAGFRPRSMSVVFDRINKRLVTASIWFRPAITHQAQDHLAKRKANCAIALLKLNEEEEVWPLLRHRADNRSRSYFIHRAGKLLVDPTRIIVRAEREADTGIKRALVQCLGEFRVAELSAESRQKIFHLAERLYVQSPRYSIRASAEWLLRSVGRAADIEKLDTQISKLSEFRGVPKKGSKRSWYLTSVGHTMVVVPADKPLVGPPQVTPRYQPHKVVLARKSRRRFAIASREVTRGQVRQFYKERPKYEFYDPGRLHLADDLPYTHMSWYELADYCNWLSAKEGIPPTQWCYRPNPQGEYAEGMSGRDNYTQLTGYRLPTGSEWEFACRAGTITRRHYGESDDLLVNYAWYRANSKDITRRSALTKPNDLGIFGMLGNVREYCHERSDMKDYRGLSTHAVGDEPIDRSPVTDNKRRLVYGGSYDAAANYARAGFYFSQPAKQHQFNIGFRPVRTLR